MNRDSAVRPKHYSQDGTIVRDNKCTVVKNLFFYIKQEQLSTYVGSTRIRHAPFSLSKCFFHSVVFVLPRDRDTVVIVKKYILGCAINEELVFM